MLGLRVETTELLFFPDEEFTDPGKWEKTSLSFSPDPHITLILIITLIVVSFSCI